MSRTTVPRRRVALLVGLLALLAAGCGGGAAADPVLDSDEPRTVQLTVDGRDRSYLLQPALGGQRDERALVVVLHQEGGTPEGVAAETELQDLRRKGAVLAYPAGIDRSWDAGKCCGLPSRQGVDDVRFLDAVLDDAAEQTRIARERTALVGYSSGGMLTYRYVCARPGRLAAAVVVSGSLESPCSDAIEVPDVLALHGKRDGTIGLDRPIFIEALGLAPRPAASTLRILAKSAGCREGSTETAPDAEIRRWEGCRGGSVTARIVVDAGHGWAALDATRRTSEFLADRLLGS